MSELGRALMGEIVDDMIDGWSCSVCGMYFEESHGYPVLCDDCHERERRLTGKEPQTPKATEKKLG